MYCLRTHIFIAAGEELDCGDIDLSRHGQETRARQLRMVQVTQRVQLHVLHVQLLVQRVRAPRAPQRVVELHRQQFTMVIRGTSQQRDSQIFQTLQ